MIRRHTTKFVEGKIKGDIAETIVEFMLRDMGFFVARLGQENSINSFAQISDFIKNIDPQFNVKRPENHKVFSLSQKGHFVTGDNKGVLEKNITTKYASSKHLLSKLPDFVVMTPYGDTILLEVKFRYYGDYEGTLDFFNVFPSAYLLLVSADVDSPNRSRFMVYSLNHERGEGYISEGFNLWASNHLRIENKECKEAKECCAIIDEYSALVINILKNKGD